MSCSGTMYNSYRMTYTFLAPLVLGAICLVVLVLRPKRLPGSLLFAGLILYLKDGRHHPAPADAD